jgi:hypothetical protein
VTLSPTTAHSLELALAQSAWERGDMAESLRRWDALKKVG